MSLNFHQSIIAASRRRVSALPNVLDGLTSWWKLDDASGTTAVDSAGSNNGTLINSPDWTTGQINGGIELNGTNQSIESFPAQVMPHGDRTITAWVVRKSSTTGTSGDMIIANRGGGTVSNGIYFWLNRTNAGSLSISHIARTTLETSGGVVPIDTWCHVAYTYSGTTAKLYVNGVEEATDTVVLEVAGTSNGNIGRSANNFSTDRYFQGTLDDIRIYDRALTAAEILTVYNWRE